MKRYPSLVTGAALLMVTTLTAGFPLQTHLSTTAFQREHGQGDLHRDDPCDQLPDPPGQANGIDKICAAGGSSSGIAKGDFNGDGFADLAVGIPGEDTPNDVSNSGAVNVIYRSGVGLTTSTDCSSGGSGAAVLVAECHWVPGSSEAEDAFGSALAAGDFNGDGYSDLAIGVPGEDLDDANTGAVIVIYGSRNGLTATDPNVPAARFFDLRTATEPSGWDFHRGGASLGSSLGWGDFNGDGRGDLAIGASRADVFEPGIFQFFAYSDAGIVWVLTGTRDGGLDLAGNRVLLDSLPFGGDLLGKAITSGDFDGDGFFDLAVGQPGWLENRGLVLVWYGSSLGFQEDPDQPIGQEIGVGENVDAEVGARFGSALAAADFNGDGRADLAVGAPGYDAFGIVDAGLVHVFYGTTRLVTELVFNQAQVFGAGAAERSDQFGTVLAAGDFNGDGCADLAIGVPLEDVVVNSINVVDAGEVDVLYGPWPGLSNTGRAPQAWRQSSSGIADDPQEGDHFGASLTAWNFGRNEFVQGAVRTSADLAIGVPYEDLSGIGGAGAVNVIY